VRVRHDRTIALAEDELSKGLFSAVEVIEERCDDEISESHSFVVFNSVKFLHRTKVQYTGKERRKGKEWRENPEKYGCEQRAKTRGEGARRNVTVGQEMV
jgi:hypothetical protein